VDRDEELISQHVERHPIKRGIADARLREFGTPIWALAGYYLGMGCDIERVAADYDLPIEAVVAALAYYRRHKAVIDARIDANVA
jgi:uncharacterized protein (DUF433 family)